MAKHISSKPEPDHRPVSINPRLRQRRRKEHPASYYVQGIRAGDRVILSQAITLVESKRPADQSLARDVVEACLPYSGKSFRLGLTGVPGVGKSTFIEAFGLQLIEAGYRPAVLAVDPTSQLSGGSILGDKTRMAKLSLHPEAFIRPSPAGKSLGGVAAKTREVMLLCEAAGFDYILIETVGVGQSEVAVHALTDFFLLLLLPGGGDELQGMKRGVVEMADLIAINKADDDRELAARQACSEYQRALHLYPPKPSGWSAQAVICSAITGKGLSDIREILERFRTQAQESGYLQSHRQEQAVHWFEDQLQEALLAHFYEQPDFQARLHTVKEAVRQGQLSPRAGVWQVLSPKE
ncbi:MAG: methylmalonyl Co-A mutase-associated GTPase MeaB [Bacteroidetes bacterium]|nr:MAG: methylmalonyl Co-A mutase-associated GTPase MeaB [Bacteroidota bacterium]